MIDNQQKKVILINTIERWEQISNFLFEDLCDVCTCVYTESELQVELKMTAPIF